MASHAIFRLVVSRPYDPRSQSILSQLPAFGVEAALDLELEDLYFLEGDLSLPTAHNLSKRLVCDPLTDSYELSLLTKDHPPDLDATDPAGSLTSECSPPAIEVLFRPGVTDNVAKELLQAAHRIGVSELKAVATGTRYQFARNLPLDELDLIVRNLLVNDTIQRYAMGKIRPHFEHYQTQGCTTETFDLPGLDQDRLMALSSERRLALDLHEMTAIQAFFRQIGRPVTDAELEMLAQTWSEHCIHKTFKALIECSQSPPVHGDSQTGPASLIDSLIHTYLISVTETIGAQWVRSAFVDNAGVIEFDHEYDLSFKVETHNHPSAIEPFGGANTGIGGVVRDILGVSHRPIANTDVLCFGMPETRLADLSPGILHPARIRSGVVSGIEDYGNKLGLPTVNGAIFYHPGYTANPLVFCGSVGIGERDCHPRSPRPGDRIIVIGGRVGRDGLRGATFSSLAMDAHTSEVANVAVQIGDPITEKGIIEIVSRASEAELYHAITDCGAGGLSSAIGEMSAQLGAKVDLSSVRLKYQGLSPWEIWLSEAQERMVLAVAPDKVGALADLCQDYWVEWCDVGEFQSSGRIEVTYGDSPVVDLPNEFLHHGMPRLHLTAILEAPRSRIDHHEAKPGPKLDESDMLLALLGHPNLASKEDIIRVYDHQVRGATIIPPLVGVESDGPSDAAVLKPLETEGWRGFVLANGINPYLGEFDPYAMAVSAVDEAVRNAVAVGADPHRIAILDNFCWGDPRRPELLGQLVRAVQGCHDAALHLATPFISGKDSLNNEYRGADGSRHAVPGTLLISSIAIHPDVRRSVSMDLKAGGNLLYLVGEWSPALAGSHAVLIGGNSFFANHAALNTPPCLPTLARSIYVSLFEAIHAGRVQSAHDLSEGGIAVCAAEMSLAGRLGVELDLRGLDDDRRVALFSEANSCFVVEIEPKEKEAFEAIFLALNRKALSRPLLLPIGRVVDRQYFKLAHNGHHLFEIPLDDIVQEFKSKPKYRTS